MKGTHRPTDVPDGRLHAPSQSACLNPTSLCGCRRSPKWPRVDGSTSLAVSNKLTARASSPASVAPPAPSSALRALLRLASALLRMSPSPAHPTSASLVSLHPPSSQSHTKALQKVASPPRCLLRHQRAAVVARRFTERANGLSHPSCSLSSSIPGAAKSGPGAKAKQQPTVRKRLTAHSHRL